MDFWETFFVVMLMLSAAVYGGLGAIWLLQLPELTRSRARRDHYWRTARCQ